MSLPGRADNAIRSELLTTLVPIATRESRMTGFIRIPGRLGGAKVDCIIRLLERFNPRNHFLFVVTGRVDFHSEKLAAAHTVKCIFSAGSRAH